MTNVLNATTDSALKRLDWESNHFGVSAAQIVGGELTDAALAEALHLARRQGLQLAVWPAQGDRELPEQFLHEFHGALVDRKLTYTRSLAVSAFDTQLPEQPGLKVVEYTADVPSGPLVELALAAGGFSRFRVDAMIPHEKFESMYRIWIERSVKRELADVVLVAPLHHCDTSAEAPLAAMVTISLAAGQASIGLIAVASAARGQGVGSTLMRAAHHWMREHGANEARVVTQRVNLPACRLYERSGYQVSNVQTYFHFWL